MKKYCLSLLSLILAVGCMVAYNIIGAKVSPDGILVEPFFLMPISCIFGFIAIILALVAKTKECICKKC